jgi:hypothetical protein
LKRDTIDADTDPLMSAQLDAAICFL